MSDKTEQPTARRLRRAQLEGDSAVSSALVQACVFIVALALLPRLLRSATAMLQSLLEQALTQGAFQVPGAAQVPGAPELHSASAFSAADFIATVALLSLPIAAAGALTAIAIGAVQTGGALTFKKLAPDLNRVNPLQGLKNLLRVERLVALVRALITALLVAWIASRLVISEAASLANAVGQLEAGARAGLSLAQTLGWVAALVGLAFSALDLLAVRHSWLKRLRMSKDDIRREHRQAEGDPEVKAARQRAHREALGGAMLNAVKEATVVIVNPTHLATALRYDEAHDAAPKVVSQGAGDFARKIIEAAHAYGVPVVRDVPVAQALAELELGDEIPEVLYEAVAEVLHEVLGHPEPPPA